MPVWSDIGDGWACAFEIESAQPSSARWNRISRSWPTGVGGISRDMVYDGCAPGCFFKFAPIWKY